MNVDLNPFLLKRKCKYKLNYSLHVNVTFKMFCITDFGFNNRWFLRYVYRSRSFQLLQCFWSLAACVVLMYTYKSAIISAFAANKLIPKIVTIDQLLKDTSVAIGTYKQTYLHTFCKVSLHEPILTYCTIVLLTFRNININIISSFIEI